MPLQVMGEAGKAMPLYVATKKVNETRYGPLRQHFGTLVFLRDVLEEVLPGTPTLFLGPIEQVLHFLQTLMSKP